MDLGTTLCFCLFCIHWHYSWKGNCRSSITTYCHWLLLSPLWKIFILVSIHVSFSLVYFLLLHKMLIIQGNVVVPVSCPLLFLLIICSECSPFHHLLLQTSVCCPLNHYVDVGFKWPLDLWLVVVVFFGLCWFIIECYGTLCCVPLFVHSIKSSCTSALYGVSC